MRTRWPTRSLTSHELRREYSDVMERAASGVRKEFPNLVGIRVHGSAAREEQGPFSDIDMLAVTGRRTKWAGFSYFEGDIYVGVGFLSVAQLEKEFTDPNAFFWARGSAAGTRILFDPKGVLHRMQARWKRAEPSSQLLESLLWDEYHNIVEYSGKLRNGWLRRDEYLTRHAALVIAQHVEKALVALNDISIISENYLWHQVLNGKKRPRHFRTDYPLVRGLRGTEDFSKVYRSAMRLCKETLRLVRDEFGRKARNKRFRRLLAEPLESHGL